MDPIQSWVDPDEVRRLAEGLITRPVRRSAPREEAGYGSEWVGFTSPEQDAAVLRSHGTPEPDARPVAVTEPPTTDSQPQIHARQSLAAARRIAEQSGLLAGSSPATATQAAPAATQRALPPAAAPTASPSRPEAAPASSRAEPARPSSFPSAPASPFVDRLQRFGAWLHQQLGARAFFVTTRDGDVLIDEIRSPQLLQVARTLAHASRTANRQAGCDAVGSLHVKLGPDGVLEVIPLNCRYGPLVLGVIVSEVLSAQAVEAAAAGLQQVVDRTAGNP